MTVELERTKQFYAGISPEELCDCDPCQNYYRTVKTACPQLTAFLAERGAEADKPMEVVWYVEKEHTVTCSGMYVLCGSVDKNWKTTLDGADAFISPGFPTPRGVEEPYFVLEAGPYTLNWNLEKPFEEAFPEK